MIPTASATTRAVTGASPVTMTVRTPRPSQLGNERRRIFARRITQRNHSGNEQLLCRSHRDNEYAEAFGLKFFNHRRRRRTRLGNRRDDSKAPLTIFIGLPSAPITAASDIFRVGSKAVKVTSFHRATSAG